MIDLTGSRIAAIFAHPDDEAFTIGGVISAFTERGATVFLICATRGEEGEISHPSLATRENLGEVREQELHDAAAILGITGIHFLDFRDSGMFGTESNGNADAFVRQPVGEVAARLAKILDELRPDILFTFSEEGGYLHPDHIHIHESVVELSQRAPHLTPHLYFTSFPRDLLLEIVNQDHGALAGMSEDRRNRMGQPMDAFAVIASVDPYVERKSDAFRAHKTQQPKEGERDFLESDEDRRRFAQNEYYIRATTSEDVPDPLLLLVADLPGSVIVD